MAEFPSLPLFVDAWITDTHHLTRLERGTYLDLLVLMWITPECRVPNDKLWLSKRLKLPIDIIEQEVMPLVCEYCIRDGNWITQGRLRQEFQYLRDTHHRQSANAKSRWRKEKRLSQVDASGIGVAYAPTPTPTPTKKEPGEYVLANGVKIPVAKTNGHNKPEPQAKPQQEYTRTFLEFWAEYPRKDGKKEASIAFEKALKKTTLSAMLAALAWQKPRWKDPDFIQHAATWLNKQRWADEPPPTPPEPKFFIPR